MAIVSKIRWLSFTLFCSYLLYCIFIKTDFLNQPITALATTHNSNNTLEPTSFMFYFRLGLVGFSLMLSLIYGLVFVSNFKNRTSFWFMIFAFFFGIGHLGLYFPYIESNTINKILFFVFTNTGISFCAIASLQIILDISKTNINNKQYYLCVGLIVAYLFIIINYFLDLPIFFNNCLYVIYTGFIIAITYECYVHIQDAYNKKNVNYSIVIAVDIVSISAATYIFPSHLVTVKIVNVSILLMPFSIAIILAFLFAKSFIDLQKKQEEVKRLSKEKEWILERQTELLSHQVAEQTAELKALNATKDRLFSIISHDLRTPIYSILGTLDLFENKVLNQEESADLLKNLRYEVSNSYEVLDNLLHWSLSQIKQFDANKINFDLINAVSPSLELFRGIIQKKGIDLSLYISDDLSVYADENHIRCIVRNLLSNAIKFTPTAGKIEVLANKNKNFVELIITDSGIGIAPNDLKSIFTLPKINYAVNGEKGTGLGLNLCKELIESNGGSISVKSEYRKGTSFVVKMQMTR
jgi:signal transduction histidine kinase